MRVRGVRNALLVRGCQPRSRNCGSSLYFLKGGKEKLKSRKRQRENRRAKQREECIDKRNDYGIKDLTAYNAVLQIKTNGKANIVLR